MPGLRGVWRTICRFVAHINTPSNIDADAGSANSVHWGNDGTENAGIAGGRLYEFSERIAVQAQETQRNSEQMRREAARKDRRAKRRSLILLMRLLNQEQRREFRELRHFYVTGGKSGTRYRIRADRIANIDVLRDNGRVKHRLCVHPTGGVPLYDVMAAQLLHLQDPASEQRLLEQANIH